MKIIIDENELKQILVTHVSNRMNKQLCTEDVQIRVLDYNYIDDNEVEVAIKIDDV